MPVPAGRSSRLARLALAVALAAPVVLAGCASKPKSELAVTADPAEKADDKSKDDKSKDAKDDKPAAVREADSDPGPPLERHEAAGQCWMLADKRGGSLDAKTAFVDKCIDDRLKADATKRGAPARR